MDALRIPLSLNTLSKIETGRRDVSLDELVGLAAALGTPPIHLVFPLGHRRSVELFPGERIDTWDAARWFTGEDRPPRLDLITWSDLDEATEDWPVMRFREHDRLEWEWEQARRALTLAREKAGGADWDTPVERPDHLYVHLREAQYLEEVVRTIETQLRRHRTAMRRAGLDPGALPADLAHVEGGSGDGER